MDKLEGRVLIIAGSDCSGGAGLQADLKTVTCLGGYGMTAVTALTAQNTLGVQAVCPVSPDFLRQQLDSVVSDMGVDAVKTGMLHDRAVIETVCSVLDSLDTAVPVVVDPVMVAKGGASLLEADAVQCLREKLLPRATVLTPNLPEAAALLGRDAVGETMDERIDAARALQAMGTGAVLLKGGHGMGTAVVDVLVYGDDVLCLTASRLHTRHTHGTGCTMASALATRLGQGYALPEAVMVAHQYVQQALMAAPGFGQGHGPLGHLFFSSS